MVCAVKPAGKVAVRDLASGEVSEIAVGELSARPPTIRENDAAMLHADVVRASPARYRTGERREQHTVGCVGQGKAPQCCRRADERGEWHWGAVFMALDRALLRLARHCRVAAPKAGSSSKAR